MFVLDGEAQSNVVASEEEKPANTSKASPEYPRECIVAQKEMDMNAGREENEVHERSSVLESNPSAESETTVKSKGGISYFYRFSKPYRIN